MLKMFRFTTVLILWLVSCGVYAKTGDLFRVVPSSDAGHITLNLCLNGKGPVSCQNYRVNSPDVQISPTLQHNYAAIGVFVSTPGYKATGCTLYQQTGYCLFAASPRTARVIHLKASTQTKVPGAPTNVTATAGNASAAISWLAPEDNGSPITGYTVTASPSATCSAKGTTASCTGLTNGTVYNFTVTAANANGNSVSSKISNLVTPTPYDFIYRFSGVDGWGPNGGLIQATDGNFYGMTNSGGLPGRGNTFMITPSGVESNLYSFVSGVGANPSAGLIQASDGNFYGTTFSAGTHGFGTVFKITPSGILSTIYNFGDNANDGREPIANLIEGLDGNFYGTTLVGGSYGSAYTGGTVFQVTPAGVETVIHSFGNGTDGANISASLTQDSLGNLYGVASQGGEHNVGMVFKLSTSGTETILYNFKTTDNDGYTPNANLILGKNGNYYGTTSSGGANNSGTVYMITPSGVETVLYSFKNTPDGAYPHGPLVIGSDNNFYGTTQGGGQDNNGTIFKLTSDNQESVIYSFGPLPDGNTLLDGLTLGVDGSLYGMTSSGGSSSNYGTLFKLAPTYD